MRGEKTMKKRNALKGFTLIEMIIVIAIFGLLMAAALSMIDPVSRVYKNAYRENDTQSISENLRRYIGDQLQYADRMAVYTGMSLEGSGEATVQYQVDKFRERYYFVPGTGSYLDGGVAKTGIKERIYPYSGFKGNDEIFVLRINNPAMDLDDPATTVGVSSRLGTVTLSRYVNGAVVSSKEWSTNTTYYNDYAFKIGLQTAVSQNVGGTVENKYVDLEETAGADGKINPSNLAMGIKMYRKHALKPDFASADFIDSYTNRTITFKLKNLISRTNAIATESIAFQDNVHFSTVEEVKRFLWFDNARSVDTVSGAAASEDIYFIFTKAPVIENLV